MTPAARIQNALAAWPGREVDVALAAGVSKSRLRVWAGYHVGPYSEPTEADAAKVEVAVLGLLEERLGVLQVNRQCE